MKKAFLVLTVFFVALFFVAACSKDDNKKKQPEMGLTIENNGAAVDSLNLYSNQYVYLKGVVRDKNNVIQLNVPIAWSCTSGLGQFTPTNIDISTPVFIVSAAQNIPEGDLFIRADYKGFFKQIPVYVDTDTVTVTFNIPLTNTSLGAALVGGTMVSVRAVVTRSNGNEDTTAIISWSTEFSVGTFTGGDSDLAYNQSYSGGGVWYLVPDNLGTGASIRFIAKIRGEDYMSDPVPVVMSSEA